MVKPPVLSPLHINSLEELVSNETEILRRINDITNGPNLFVIHPFRLFTEIQVRLSDQAHRALLRREPGLALLSEAAYEALKRTQERQRVRFHLRGLFQRSA